MGALQRVSVGSKLVDMARQTLFHVHASTCPDSSRIAVHLQPTEVSCVTEFKKNELVLFPWSPELGPDEGAPSKGQKFELLKVCVPKTAAL